MSCVLCICVYLPSNIYPIERLGRLGGRYLYTEAMVFIVLKSSGLNGPSASILGIDNHSPYLVTSQILYSQ